MYYGALRCHVDRLQVKVAARGAIGRCRYPLRVVISPNDARPLSVQIAVDLRRRITSGEFAVGAKLPSLRALALEYGVAELTVHAAVKELQRRCVVISTPGRGTFVHALPSDSAGDSGGGEHAALREEIAALRERVEELERDQRKR